MAQLSDVLVQELLTGRYVASFATYNQNGSIHVVAVWYYFEGSCVYVATASNTRKAQNLQANPKCTLMIDSRDPAASRGVSIVGEARIVTGETAQQLNEKIHRKYLSDAAIADQRVGPVFAAWDNVAIQITPASVVAWDMREADRQAFGGALKQNPGYLLPLEL